MADVFLFIRHGWKNIWKQKTIWLFSMLPILNQLFNTFRAERTTDFLPSFIFLMASFVFIILIYISFIGVPYLAYCFLIGKSATIQETLSAAEKFSGRVIGCSCLGIIAFSPVFLLALAVSTNNSTQFTIVSFFENDWGIRQSLDKAWHLFKSNFGALSILGLILVITFRAYSAMSITLTVLIQSGFDITSISNLNMFIPSTSLSKNLLFVLINGIGQTIFTPLSASIFISAYLKYSDVKLPFLMRVK